MANDLTRKIMANIAAKSITPRTNEGCYGNISASEEASLASVIHGGRKPSAPARQGHTGGSITLAALAQQKRHG